MKTIASLKQDLLNNEVITVNVKGSTNITMYSYNPNTEVLSILFKKGTLYKYNNVGKDVVLKFLNTSMINGSIGQTFRRNVLNKYTYTRFDDMGAEKYTVSV